MGKTKRILCFLVALIMILSIVPINSIVFAIGVETAEDTENTQTETPSVVPSGTSTSGLPSATVKKLASETVTDYRVYDLIGKGSLTEGNGVLDPQVLMQFIAKDTAEEAKKNQYANYTTDFFIKVEGLEQPTAGTGCYLIGNYGSFGWIAIPLDGINVENTVYPVITPVGFNFTYVDICESVKDFKCGIYFTTEFLNANPDFKITLELGLSANADKAIAGEYIKVGDSYTYSATGLQTPTDFVVDSNVTGDTAKVEEVMSNTSLDKFIPVNVPDGAELVIKLTGVGDKITYDIAPFVKDTTTKVENLTEAIIFRIPVPASITESYVKLTHDGKYAGIYEVKGTGNAKYIQVSSADFSEFALEPVSTAPVASVNGITYATFAEALTAANALTGDVTVEIFDKVTWNVALSGNYTSITFVGKDTDAEMYLEVQGYLTATGKKVAFEDLKLSKSQGGYITNAGFMNVAFGVYDVVSVDYTNCTFLNGACASAGTVTYTDCTFYKSWDKYGLWAYGDADVTVEGCTFADDRGIKMFAEDKANTTNLTVSNTDFSVATGKPAIVLTYGESVTLGEGNTYPSTGVFELDLDGQPNGTVVNAANPAEITCKNDNGVCGVLVDGKIYTTVAQAAEAATAGSKVTLLHDSAETVELPEGVTLDTNGYTAENVTVKAPAYVAMIGEDGYETLAEALAAVKGETGKTIVLLADASISGQNALDALTGNTIDLNDKTLTVSGNSYFSNGTTTFTNGNIVVSGYASDSFFCGYTAGAVIVFDDVVITGDSYSTGCAAFNANLGKVEIKNSEITLSGDTTGGVIYGGSVVIDNTTINATNVCRGITNSVATVQNGTEFTFDGGETGLNCSTVTIDNSVVTIKNATKRAVRLADNTLELTNGATLTATGCAADIVKSSETSNAVVKVDATSTLDAVDNTTSYVAQIGDVKYETLEEAFKAATEGCVIEILADVVIDYKWDCRDYATNGSHSQFKESVTINGNDKTIKFTNAISDGNWNTVFRFEENAVVNNLTIDISEATGALRVITAKKSLTVDGLTIVGSAKYGIIFGEGATADDLAATEIVIKNSNLNGTRRAISDNEGGKDVKSAIITDNTLNANVYVSASESITFNNNTTKGEVDLRSYTANNALNVTAQGNTLTSGVKNYIEAGGTVDAQEGFDVPKVYVAMIGEVGYETLAEAIAALKDGDTLTILAGEISEGTIKFPASLNNVTIKGENGAILKDMILMTYDGNTISYEGITFDGIVFDNSKIVVTGWRSNGVTLSDWTIKNCTFKNISSTDTTAAVHFNLAATEAVNGFTFTNNVIDNLTGGDKSGLYLQATGNVVIKDNVINNVAFRPYVVQITTDDGIADNFTVTGNTFSGSAAGRAQGLGNNSEGTDTVNLVVNNNIFKGITNAQQICYWNFNAETTTADMSKNYYDVDIIENPSAIYFNGSASSIYDLNDMGVFPIYKELNADGTINLDSEFTPDLTVYVAQVGEEKFATVLEALNYAIENGVTEVKILESARELMPTDVELMLKANLTITADKEVTISFYNDGTTYDFIINSDTEYGEFVFTVGENVSFVLEDRVIWLGFYGNDVDVVVNGTLSAYQIWHGANTTVNATGTLKTTGEALVMRRGALLTVDGGKVDASYFNILSGSIDAKNGAVIDSGAFWIDNTGAYASSEGAVSISIKDSTLTSSGNFKAVTDASINVTIDNSKVAFTDFDGYGASVVDAKTTVTITNLSEVSFKNVTNDGRIVISSDVDLTTANELTNVEADDESKKVVYEDGKYVFVDRVVAEVNGVEYSTLASAIEALRANGGTLKLRDNIRGSITLNYPAEGAPTEITIDLNGFTITSAESTIFVADGYVVTIKDSSEAKTGKIVSTNAGGEAIAINRNGHVILESGYVYNDYCAVWLYNSTGNGTFVMNGGTIEVPNGGTGIIVGAGTVTINGGKVLCNKTPISGGGWNSYIYANGTMIITGGEFLGTIGCAGTIAISGGTFSYCDDPNDGFNSAHLAAGYGTQTNDDGSITVVKLPVAAKIDDTEYETIEAALKAAKNGDTIVLLADCAMAEVVELRDIALTIEGDYTITLNDKLKVLGETTLNITSALAGEVLLEDGAIIANSTINGSVYIQGNVTFRGKNTFVMMYDYGTAYTPNHQWTLEKGASLTLTSTDRYGFGYGDKITIVGSIADALTARETITDSAIVVNMYGGLVGMTNSSYADTNSKFEAKDAYIIFGVNGDKSFGNKPNNSNENAYYYGNYEYIFTNSVVTANGFKFYEDNGNSVVVFTDSDLLVNGVFMTNDASSKFTFTNCIILSKATLNGNDDKNQNAGEMILIGTSLTYNAMFTNNGTIKLDANSCLTAPSIVGNGNIIIDLAGFTGTKTIINANMTGFTGTIEIINNDRATFKSSETGVVVTVAIPEVPSATTNPVVLRPELVYGLNFSADSITPEQLEYFGDYFADFVITFNQDVTLDADGDVYLTGEYGDYGWISVPFEPITIKAGESIRIMEYAAELFDKEELQITYKDVVELVKNFNCGVYVSPEFAAANPNFKVSINLNMYDPADETETPIAVECVDKVTQQPTQTTFGNEDIKRVVASAIDAEGNETFYLTLAEAIAAAQDGETVKLYEDVDSVGTIDKAITINGNKFTLNGNILILADVTFDGVLSLTGNVKVTNGATLTIAKTANVTGATSFFGAGNDASYYGMANGDAANGTIVINGTLKAQQINANNGGNIVINSGATATFEIVCIENGDMGEAAGTMTVNGTLNTQRFNIFAGGIATVNAGGLVNSEQEFTSSDLANVISIWGGGELNINGGKVVCATVEHTEGRHSGVNVADGAINMTAGKFICGGNLVLSGKLSVTGGSADIASIESTGDIYLEGDATITTPTEGLSITAPAGYNVVYAAGVYSVEEKVIESLGFYGSSVVTTGILQMNIYLDPSNVYANGDNYYIVLTVDGVEVGRVNKADWSKDSNGNYFVSVAVPARAMTDVISAQLYDIDGDLIKEYKDTVEAYATYILTYNLYSVELRTALVAMLNYGAEAQKVFGYKLDKLANANIDAYQNLVANIDTSMSTEDFEADYSKDFVFYTHTIEAGSSLALNLYYNNVYAGDAVIIDEANRANTKVTISYTNYDGEAITTVLTGDKLNFTAENTLKVSVTGLAASDIHTDVTVVVEVDGQVVSTVTDSIEAYCAYTTADMPEMEAVSKAIMAYGNATKAYFESLKN
ncbi:MAG: hypothetical protein IJX02_02905 [Clostridia bacterium]|nr:hypothetical protein [Clostridia bacterium]